MSRVLVSFWVAIFAASGATGAIGMWREITFDVCNPDYVDTSNPPFDPAAVVALVVQFRTNRLQSNRTQPRC